MLLESLIKKAADYARKRHNGQLREGGEPFFNHVHRVAQKSPQDPVAVAAAYLHDVVEDNRARPEDVLFIFGQEVYNLVMLLTRNRGESYKDYIKRIINSGNTTAMRIKLADNEDNLSSCEPGIFPPKLEKRQIDRWNMSKEMLLAAL